MNKIRKTQVISSMPFNRTILELKFDIEGITKRYDKETFNRTILELKYFKILGVFYVCFF